MTRKTSDHGNIWIYCLSDWSTLFLKNFIVFINPTFSLFRVQKGKGERSNPKFSRTPNCLPIGTSYPNRRMRFLYRFRNNVSRWHREILSFATRIGGLNHHLCSLSHRFQPHLMFLGGIYVEGLNLNP